MSASVAVLCIAGSDPHMGAGLQMDEIICRELGVEFRGVVAVETQQGADGLESVQVSSAETVGEQVLAAIALGSVKAIKTGALGDEKVVGVLSEIFTDYPAIPLVVDPVGIASQVAVSGVYLLTPLGQAAAAEKLFPLADVITPNLAEYENGQGYEKAEAVLVTDGHGIGVRVEDRLFVQGVEVACFRHRRETDFSDVHGTGCALSSAIACRLAQGRSTQEACHVCTELVALLRAVGRF